MMSHDPIDTLDTVWEKIRLMKSRERWLADAEEEYEDSAGNVVNKKTYNDLRRQGLL